MKFRFVVFVAWAAAAVSLGNIELASGRGFGSRGGTSLRIGRSGPANQNIRYYGPSFSMGPRVTGSYRSGANQLQQRPWYYSRSGPFEYYRPYNPLYQSR